MPEDSSSSNRILNTLKTNQIRIHTSLFNHIRSIPSLLAPSSFKIHLFHNKLFGHLHPCLLFRHMLCAYSFLTLLYKLWIMTLYYIFPTTSMSVQETWYSMRTPDLNYHPLITLIQPTTMSFPRENYAWFDMCWSKN